MSESVLPSIAYARGHIEWNMSKVEKLPKHLPQDSGLAENRNRGRQVYVRAGSIVCAVRWYIYAQRNRVAEE